MAVELLLTAVLLGAGLAMDAFSVSLANGLNERNMSAGRTLTIAGTFAGFQFAMPLIGWLLVHTAVERFRLLETFIPWIALALLLYIGGKMLIEGIRENRGKSSDNNADGDSGVRSEADRGEGTGTVSEAVSAGDLVLQGIATSIDALSVGFAIAEYSAAEAAASSLIIGIVTLAICIAGLRIGRKLGTLLAGKASILGGIILIGIGLEIWIRGVFM